MVFCGNLKKRGRWIGIGLVGLHSAWGLEQGEDVSVGVLENCKVSYGWHFLFCSDHLCTYACGFCTGFIDGVDGEIVDELFVWSVAFEESAHGLVCRRVFVSYQPVFLFSPFGELPVEELLVELAYGDGIAGGYFEVN